MDLAIFIVIAFALVCGALASLSQRQATNVSCFYPDGNAAVDWQYVPCSNSGEYSSCCIPSENDICLQDGLCYYPIQAGNGGHGNYIYRGACTDETFKSKNCATFCTEERPGHYERLLFCNASSKFCCQDAVNSGSCCDAIDQPGMALDIIADIPPNIISVIRNSSVPLTYMPSSSFPLPTSFLPPTNSPLSPSSSLMTSTTSPTSSNSTGSNTDSSQPVLKIVGIVAGLLAFFALIAAVLWLYRWTRRPSPAVQPENGENGGPSSMQSPHNQDHTMPNSITRKLNELETPWPSSNAHGSDHPMPNSITRKLSELETSPSPTWTSSNAHGSMERGGDENNQCRPEPHQYNHSAIEFDGCENN